MQIPALTPPQVLDIQPGPAPRPGQWAVGQILQATAGGSGEAAGLAPGSVLLRIGAEELAARSDLKLPPGTRLTLQVIQGGRIPLLQILAGADPRAEVAATAARQALPRQGSLLPLLNSLLGTSMQPAALLDAIPELGRLGDGPTLQRAVAASGIFLEAKLAKLSGQPRTGGPDPDLKAGLLRLGKHPDPAIRGQAEAGLARIQLDQLGALQPRSSAAQVWTLDLPIRDGNQASSVRLRLEREPRRPARAPGAPANWHVALELKLAELGPVHARLSLGGTRLDARLWAERPETLELMHEFSHILERRLAGSGFADAAIKLYPGRPAPPREEAYFSDLIDVQT